jgi:cell division protein FtsB
MAGKSGYGFAVYVAIALVLGGYFAFSAIQGDLGVLARLEVEARIERLEAQRGTLQGDVTELKNKTLRLSDSYLDLDLLDERARAVLGVMRADELVVK